MGDIQLSQFRVRSLFGVPAEEVRASQLRARAVADFGPDVRISQFRVRALIRGRIQDPQVRAYTFTIDGHDFYVLRCGNIETLVFDTHSKEWYVWGSEDSEVWRAYSGCNWLGGRRLAGDYSNVVVTDDANGALYFLDPEGETDDHAIDGSSTQVEFTRIITAQYVLPQGYDSSPCYGLNVFGSVGQADSTLSVELKVSDDRGLSFESYGEVSLTAEEYDARLRWGSLGAMRAPGRLFQIVDTGALRRIDHIEMDDVNG